MNAKGSAGTSNIHPTKCASLTDKKGASDENAARLWRLRRIILKRTEGTYCQKHRSAKHEKEDENRHR
jgi:hypothetical protein